ncbi:MAG: hypothetical protein Kow001_06620 [Acidobacteriota bacterium]
MHPHGIPQGELTPGSPLFTHLAQLFETWLNHGRPHLLEMLSLDPARPIYLCRDCPSGARLVCKFFGERPDLPLQECRDLLRHEYRCLRSLRPLGFENGPYRVVQPLNTAEELSCLLTEEYVPGRSLDHYIAKACHEGQAERLHRKLALLAGFLARLHTATWSRVQRNFSRIAEAFRSILRVLEAAGVAESAVAGSLNELSYQWEAQRRMWPAGSCRVHGDVTPTNFIVDGDQLTAIDLERMQMADPAYDVGMFMAELRHHFALRIQNADGAESFIGEFLRCYVRAVGEGTEFFSDLSFRSRFFMALGELRIARNEWLPMGHRRWLVEEARRCLSQECT